MGTDRLEEARSIGRKELGEDFLGRERGEGRGGSGRESLSAPTEGSLPERFAVSYLARLLSLAEYGEAYLRRCGNTGNS